MITRKIKVGEFFYYFSRSIQNIAHHSQLLFDGDTSEEGGGLHVLHCDTAEYFFSLNLKYFSIIKISYNFLSTWYLHLIW